MRKQLAEMLTATEYGLVAKALDQYARRLAVSAASRKNAGSEKSEHRARLRAQARQAQNLAREFEKELL